MIRCSRRSGLSLLLLGVFIALFSQDRRGEIIGRLDSLVPLKMQELHIPGVAVSIVVDSQVWLTKGYGVADLASGRPVDAQTTGFRVASLSKLFTATAVLQLAEAGKVDLYTDIRTYLGDVPLALKYNQPVTLHHLLTHTAGFDLSDIGDAAAEVADLYPLRELVEKHPQPQVLPPGLAHHYSNFGFALAGYIVERITGEPFPDYVQKHIFQPLEMDNSTFAQPQPEEILDNLSHGYNWKKGAYTPLPMDYSQVAPADALVSTAADMAKFMQGQLGARGPLLHNESRLLMHSQQFTANPSPFGMAYGFEERLISSMRVIDHSGGQLGFASYLLLVPGLKLGIFLAQNRREGVLRWEIVRTILEAFAPNYEYPELQTEPALPIDTRLYGGVYRHTGYTHHTFEKMAYVLGFIGSEVNIRSDGPGVLLINDERFVFNRDRQFADARYGYVTRGFIVDKKGRVIYHTAGREVFEKLRWWERKEVLRAILALSFLLALWHITLWPWLIRRRRQRGLLDPTGDNRRWRRLTYTASGLWFITFILLFAVFSLITERPVQFDYGVTWEMNTALTLLFIASVCVLAIPIATFRAWRNGWWTLSSRLGLTIYSLVLLGSIAALGYMNMLGFQY